MVVRGGRYELLSAIASGGMATVHLARALGVGGFERFVAIKVMHQNLADEAEFVAMFLDEARLAARIRHPNVVGTLDVQQDDLGLFLVMEYVEGPSLHVVNRALTKKRERMPVEIALRIFIDSLNGLHAAHELRGADGVLLNLVHRDVSPHNILISNDGVAQITDFGVARAESRLQSTRSGVVKGKIAYMSPEQIRSEPLDRRTDLFAAGALFWELLTNKRRIVGDNDAAMMHMILAGQRETPRDVNATVPEAISDACMRALALSPDDRFPSAAAFADALEQACVIDGVHIASSRALSSFIKTLGIERPSPAALAAGAPVPSDSFPSLRTGKAPSGTPSKGTGTEVPGSQIAAVASDETHAAIVAGGTKPRSANVLWPALGGAFLIGGIAAWLFTLGPLKVSFKGNKDADPAAAASTKAPPPSAGSLDGSIANAPAPIVTPAAATVSASAAASAGTGAPAPSASAPARPIPGGPIQPRPDQNPAGFRPHEL